MATWHTNATEPLTITVTENGVDVESLAGATVSFKLYDAGGVVVLSKTTDDFTVSAPTFSLTTDPEDTADLAGGTYAIVIWVTDSTGRTQPYVDTLTVVEVPL